MKLEFGSGALLLDVGDKDWCRLTLLHEDGTALDLGADTFQMVATRFVERLRALLARGEDQGGRGHFLSLFERHSSLYMIRAGAVIALRIQDAQGHDAARFSLTLDVARRWLARLEQQLARRPPRSPRTGDRT